MQGSRTTRVAQIVKEVVSRAIARGEVKDPRLSAGGLTTITHVIVSGDLRYAKVYFVVHEGDVALVAEGLQAAAGFLRRKIGEELRARAVPELRFLPDEGFEQGQRMERLLAEISEEEKAR